MESRVLFHHRPQPLLLSLSRYCSPFLPRPVSFVSFRTLTSPTPLSLPVFKFSSIKASSSSSDSTLQNTQNSKHHLIKTLNSYTSSFVKTTCIAIAAAAAALFFMRFHQKPALAVPSAPSSLESKVNASDEETERIIEEYVTAIPTDVEALRSLLEIKIGARKFGEAIGILDRLIDLDPTESQWPLLRAHMHMQNDDTEMAKQGFEEIIKKDPYRVEAYHGLIMAASDDNKSLQDLKKRIGKTLEVCKKQKRSSDARDFKLLIGQIKVVEKDYTDALMVYQELVKEEPRDFRPYLCQGIVYTLMKNSNEAEKQFEKFRRLVPKNHPYKEYFEDNMFATMYLYQKLEKETAEQR